MTDAPPADTLTAPPVQPIEGPWVVAIQPGHWKIDELPAEHARRRGNIGAVHAGVREVDINVGVVEALVPLLEAEGWVVNVVPATVPPAMRADAFISVHADWGADPGRQGWKLAPPWRPSAASADLARSLSDAFTAAPELREDSGGITVGMRGYFGFSSHRFDHASSPYTPAVLLELGFVTNSAERSRMVDRPDFYANIIHGALLAYFEGRDRSDVTSLVPQTFDAMVVGAAGATARRTPNSTGVVLRGLRPGESARVVDESGDWYEVRIGSPVLTGWVHLDELVPRGTLGNVLPGMSPSARP